jgi:vitamin B12 transporter
MKTKIIYLLVSACFFYNYSRAQDVDLERIVVTPSRSTESIKGTTSSVSVFTAEDIEKSNIDNIKDFLKENLGLDIVQTGSYGGPVSVFSRGTNSGQTQIMIDNVRVYDPIATNAAFNLAHLSMNNIERIEFVRGAQSVLYGSDAMGGVINIITKKGRGKPSFSFSSEGGTYTSLRETLDSSGSMDKFSYSFGFSRFDTRGISKLKNTAERDPYEDTSISLRADFEINENNNLGIIGRYTNAKYEYDSSFGLRDDPDLAGKEQQALLSGFFENRINDYWKHKLQLSYMGNYRRDADNPDSQFPNDYLRDYYIGKNYQIDWQHTIKPLEFDTIVCGFDWQRENGRYYYYSEYPFGGFVWSSETRFPNVHSSTKAWYAENMINLQDKFFLNTGIRVDGHSYARIRRTYKIDLAYLFKTNTKIKGGWNTAFKAPTLYQLNALPIQFQFGGGNPNLVSEQSQTYEISMEQSILSEKVKVEVTYFHTQLKNLIDSVYDPNTFFASQYNNTGKARIEGYEGCLVINPIEKIKAEIGYTWQDTENKDNGDELLRRPKNKAFLNLSLMPNDKFDFNLKLIYVGRRNDSGNQLIKAYSRLDLNANYILNKIFSTFMRIENITDKEYVELMNYAQPGRTYSGGIKLTF